MSRRYVFLPSGISTSADVRQHAVVRETFGGECFQYAVCGLSDDRRKELTGALREEIQREKLPLTAVDSGDLVLIHRAGTDKGQALRAFSRAFDFSPSEVIKFGDQAGAMGNDRALLSDDRSFNVGAEPAQSAAVRNLGRVGPEGVLATLRWLRTHGGAPRGILSDFDGTLNWGETSPRPDLDLRLAKLLVQLAGEGTQIGIVTGRGETFFRDGLLPLYRSGLDERAARNLSIYLFNGARPVRPEEWPKLGRQSVAADTFQMQRPTVPLRDTPIDAQTQKALEQTLKQLAKRHPTLPGQVEDRGTLEHKAILRRQFHDRTYQYVLAGMTPKERASAVPLLREELQRAGLPLTVVDTGRAVDIHSAKSDKGRAVADFAQQLGLQPHDVYKFGDRAGEMGNDRSLLTDDRSFNVGGDPSELAAVNDLGEVGVDGVLDVLSRADSYPAIAADFDGTLTGRHGSNPRLLDPRAAHRLLELARAGTPIAVISGRGPLLFPAFLGPMRQAGMTREDAKKFTLYLFNGARPTRIDEWPS